MGIHVEELKQAFLTIETQYQVTLKTQPDKALAILTDVASDRSLVSDRGFLSEMHGLGIFQILNAADTTSDDQKQQAISRSYNKLVGDYKSETASKEFLNLMIDVYGWNVAKYIIDEDPTPIIEEPTPLNPQPVSPNPGHSWNTSTYSGYQSSQMLPPDFEAKKEEAITAYKGELYDMAFPMLYELRVYGDPDVDALLGESFWFGRGTKESSPMAALYFKRSSEKNNPIGQYYYAGWLFDGNEGVEKNISAAIDCFEKAASQESDDPMTKENAIFMACRRLAYIYRNGEEGIPVNVTRAIEWYKKAAEGGDSLSARILAEMYEKGGEGIHKDIEAAVKWYKVAADKGDLLSITTLGDIYFEGKGGLSKDYEESFKWYSQAAMKGGYSNRFAYMMEFGLGTNVDVASATKYYGLAAEQGNQFAQCNYANNLRHGRGIEKDLGAAFFWYGKAAQQGNAYAQTGLADCFYFGYGTEIDYPKAFYWYGLAAEAGVPSAQSMYGVMHDHGEACVQDAANAFYWFEKAAMQGDLTAQSNLGYYYRCGIYVAQDYEKAIEWYGKSAEQGFSIAMYWLGWLYFNANGTLRDHQKAYNWIRKASDAGNSDAQKFLDENKSWAWRYAKTYNPNGMGENTTTTGVY